MANPSAQSEVVPSSNVENDVASENQTALAKHVAFFDRSKDGIIYPGKTYKGFRKIGAGVILSATAAIVINVAFSLKTRPGKFPSFRFPIEVKHIEGAKHGSDTGVYDKEGRFVPSKFEEIFTKHAHTNPNYLTSKEIDETLKANRQPHDLFGSIAAFLEWKILYQLFKDKNGVLQKDTIRDMYDGSVFWKAEKERQSARKTQ